MFFENGPSGIYKHFYPYVCKRFLVPCLAYKYIRLLQIFYGEDSKQKGGEPKQKKIISISTLIKLHRACLMGTVNASNFITLLFSMENIFLNKLPTKR